MQRELEKRKKNEPYKKKNVQNLKEGENKWKEVGRILNERVKKSQSEWPFFRKKRKICNRTTYFSA